MMMAATKRVRVARAMVTAMRAAVDEEGKGRRAREARTMSSAMGVVCDEEGDCDGGKSDGNEGDG